MNSWRITKYDPKNRDDEGIYQAHEWTSISEIGNTFDDSVLTLDKYLQAEAQYVKAVEIALAELNIPHLRVFELEKYEEDRSVLIEKSEFYPHDHLRIFDSVENENQYSVEDIKIICKLVLREVLWLKLAYRKDFFVHFGYDFYMYIVARNESRFPANKIKDLGLFVEEFESPYLD